MQLDAPESLAQSVGRGLAWKAVSQVALQLSRIGVAVVLARLLTPSEYGLAGMVLIFASLVIVFSDLGLGAALVQRPVILEGDRSTVFWTGLLVGGSMTILGIATAGLVADFYGQPEIKPMFAVLSITFVLSSLGTTQASLLMRTMDFRTLEVRMMIGTALGAIVGIAVAVAGYGAWAIVWQQVATTVASTVLLVLLSPWRPRFTFSLASLRRLGGFGANVFGQRLLYYLHRNIDNLLIGRFLGPAALGAYSVAYNVMLVPFSRLSGPLQEVFFPAFARIQDDPSRIAALWVRLIRVVGAVSIPSLVGLVVVAPEFVTVVLGDQWSSMVPVLRILAWVGLLQSLQTTNGDILQALDRTSTLLRYTILFFMAHLVAFVVGLHWGIVGVACGYAVSSTVVEPLYASITARALGIQLRTVLRGLSGVAQATLVMLFAVLGVRLLISPELSPFLRLAVMAGVGIVVYLPVCIWRAPELVAEARRLWSIRGRSTPTLEAAT
jgi:O-antigen/teichoic acid export membrane protein